MRDGGFFFTLSMLFFIVLSFSWLGYSTGARNGRQKWEEFTQESHEAIKDRQEIKVSTHLILNDSPTNVRDEVQELLDDGKTIVHFWHFNNAVLVVYQ